MITKTVTRRIRAFLLGVDSSSSRGRTAIPNSEPSAPPIRIYNISFRGKSPMFADSIGTAEAAPFPARHEQLTRESALDYEFRSLAFQKWVVLALLTDGGLAAVAGDYYGVVGEGEEFVAQGVDDFFEGAAGQVGAADAASEERVAGDQFLLRGEIEADAALGVPGGEEYVGG